MKKPIDRDYDTIRDYTCALEQYVIHLENTILGLKKSHEMQLTKKGLDIIKEFEGLRLESYLCPADVWTIGYGNTFYESGRPVKQGEHISEDKAERMLEWVAEDFARNVRGSLKVQLNENQFNSLVSFTYNLGIGNLRRSTLLKKVNANPGDPTIFNEFLKWNKAGGKVLNGLVRRRQAEANLYYEPIN
jgi:lysozyme